MPTRARIVAAGYPMRVILRGIDRDAVFFDAADRRYFLEWLGAAAAQESVAVHAYVLMTGNTGSSLDPGVRTPYPGAGAGAGARARAVPMSRFPTDKRAWVR